MYRTALLKWSVAVTNRSAVSRHTVVHALFMQEFAADMLKLNRGKRNNRNAGFGNAHTIHQLSSKRVKDTGLFMS